ncbi:MAG: xanthine dehydrogenase [Herminiimonas sp.]|nr:xanthine dehydrogenase [Herminiimonas sp.]
MAKDFSHNRNEFSSEAKGEELPAAASKKNSYIGRSVPRLEDLPLVTGRACFLGDISFPHQIHMRVVRSPQAHGRIVSIDKQEALKAPGVIAVWTAADIQEIPPIPFRATNIPGLEFYRQPVLACEYVRYVGEPVAVVFADDAYRAEDAADLVEIDIDSLPPIVDALTEPGEFEPGRNTEPAVLRKGYGDVDAAMAKAHKVIELELSIGRHSGIPLETRGALARYNQARDHLELHGAAKRPHLNRDQLAEMLSLPPSSIDLFESHVGGSFGVRGELYPEDVLVCLGALRLRRPVKWVEDRREHMMSTNQSRQQTHKIKAAVDAEGRILGIDEQLFHDQGAYVRTHGARVADMTIALLLGPYRALSYRAVGYYRLTNKTPAATYRSPGRYEGCFVQERLMDAIGNSLGIDPIEVRRRNLIGKEEMPYDRGLDANGAEVILDSGDYAGLLGKALAAAGWDEMRKQVAQRRAAGEAVGIGLGMFVEKSGMGPYDGAKVSVDTDGRVEVVTGAASVGQGVETVMAQICAETLGVDYKHIRVIHGQTNRIAYGNGAHASRVTVLTGGATRVAALKLREKAIDVAADMLKLPHASLDIVDGRVVCMDGSSDKSVSLGEIARNLAPASPLRGSREPGLTAEGWFHTEDENYPYGIHIAQVRVDRETGGTAVERYMIAYDVGRAVNPMLIEGQMVGGMAQGMGGALLEEFVYDSQGQPLSLTFADYLMPTAKEMPPVQVLICEDAPSPLNPLGLKGAGEGGITAAGAAIAAAIDDALGMPGVITRLPVTPQRLKQLLTSKAQGERAGTKCK